MMNHGMEQDLKAGTSRCGHRDHRYSAQKFRQPVQIDLHTTLFHDIHHVERKHHGLAEFQKL